MSQPLTVAVFGTTLAAVSLLALGAGRREPASLERWSVGGRTLSGPATWFLLGGAMFTAYTFVAVPALVYGVGGLGFFAVPYTVVAWPIALVMWPRLWRVAAANGWTTTADVVRGRYGSPLLALAVALTGILATMPYVALQLLGIRAVLASMGIPADGAAGDAVLAATFAVLAVATYRTGLRAPALIAVVKGVLVFVLVAVLAVAVPVLLGGTGHVFTRAGAAFAGGHTGTLAALTLPHHGGYGAAYSSLAFGSALALLLYPHAVTPALAARGTDVLRRNALALPAWSLVLGILALLGIGAAAAGVTVPRGHAELALPLLVERLFPAWFTGLALAVVAIAALVPTAIMSIAVANLFARNVYVEYLHPTATPEHELSVARLVSVLVKGGALVFVVLLRAQDAINLQLLGGVWILQTLPAVALGLLRRRWHHGALMAGWSVGMLVGTALVAAQHFVWVVPVRVGGWETQVYAGLLALAANLAVTAVASPLLDRWGPPRGVDTSGIDTWATDGALQQESLMARSS